MATDYTAYESHFTNQIMKAVDRLLFEHMTQKLPDRKYYLELYDENITKTNLCFFKHFNLKIEATRMSGEMNTSLSNGFANLMLTKFVLHKKNVSNVPTLVEGDDGLTSLPKSVEVRPGDFSILGFTIKILIFEKLNEASFCGLIFDERSGDVITDPIKLLSSFFYTNGKYAKATLKKKLGLLKAKAMSAYVQYKNCPIVGPLAYHYCKVLTSTKTQHKTDAEYKYKFSQIKDEITKINWRELQPPEITVDSRLLMEKIFKIPTDIQSVWEEKILSHEISRDLQLPMADIYFPSTHYLYHMMYSSSYYTDLPGHLWPQTFPIVHTIARSEKCSQPRM